VGGLSVHTGRAGAFVAPHPTPCDKQERRVAREVVQVIEPAIGIVGRPSMQLGLNPQYPKPGYPPPRPVRPRPTAVLEGRQLRAAARPRADDPEALLSMDLWPRRQVKSLDVV
jgi:hypothetical protein